MPRGLTKIMFAMSCPVALDVSAAVKQDGSEYDFIVVGAGSAGSHTLGSAAAEMIGSTVTVATLARCCGVSSGCSRHRRWRAVACSHPRGGIF